ncbi:hypothetical protein VTK26DRAFT_2753 [Humicola hyalothermophila]
MPNGDASRPVSPKTVPFPYTHNNSPGLRTEAQRRTLHTSLQGLEKSTSPYSCYIPPTPLRVNTTMSPAASRSAGTYSSSFLASRYAQAVQSPDPRSLEELNNEREYLMQNLRKQGARATRLFQRYAALAALMAEPRTPRESKKTRREAASVRAKIAESTQQEQLILLRLGEIHVELQNRGRWMQVHHQPLPHLPPLMHPPVVGGRSCYTDRYSIASSAPSQYNHCSPCRSVLSPLSPCFTPGVVFAEDIWSQGAKTSAERDTENESAPAESVDEHDETDQLSHPQQQQIIEKQVSHEGAPASGPEEANQLSGWDTDADGEMESVKAWRARSRSLSLYFPAPLKEKDRRFSLPCAKNLWPRSRRNSSQTAG